VKGVGLQKIYEITTPEEAMALARLGVDHIGVLVGDGTFPRELPVETARTILSAIPLPSRGSALCLSADLDLIAQIVFSISPSILHLGASTTLLRPEHVAKLKKRFFPLTVQRSIPVLDEGRMSIARSYDGIADILLLDSYIPGDAQIGALGVTHSWALDRAIVENVSIPVIIAGGLGPDNVRDAINAIHPAGVDSKTKTDKSDGSHTKDLDKVRMFISLAKSC
jgi:phosphoribosylanthranilate isomerase